MVTLLISPLPTTPSFRFAQVQVGPPTGVGDSKRVLYILQKKHPSLTQLQVVDVDEAVVDAVEVVVVLAVDNRHSICTYKNKNRRKCTRLGQNPVV